MKFVKMHGCANDYLYLDGATDAAIAPCIDEPGWLSLVQRMSHRHKGIGSDGVIVLCPPTAAANGAHVRMRMFNADGSESEMCGNGIRCVAKFAHDRLNIRANPMLVETGRGVLSIAYEVVGGELTSATVDMGEPILDLTRVPVDESQVTKSSHGYSIDGFKGVFDWQFVSMGNPHAISFALGAEVERSAAVRFVSRAGPAVETHVAFPNRTNVHFVSVATPTDARVFTWERGAGVTQACGTGVCASLVAGVLNGQLSRQATMRVLGGELHIRWDEATNHIFMTGPAEDICEGKWLGDRP